MLKRLFAFSITVAVAVACPSVSTAADPAAGAAAAAAAAVPADAPAEKVAVPTVGELLKGKPTGPGYYLKYRQDERRANSNGNQQGGQFLWQQLTAASETAFTFTNHASAKVGTRRPPMAVTEAVKVETAVTPMTESLLHYAAPVGVRITGTEDTLVRGEAITIGDRMYTCDHYTRTMTVANYAEAGTIVMHAWIDPALPLTGIVKRTSYLKSPREEIYQQLELLDYGTPAAAGTLPWFVEQALAASQQPLPAVKNMNMTFVWDEDLQPLRSELAYACLVGGELDIAIALEPTLKKWRDDGVLVRNAVRTYALLDQDAAACDALGVAESERRWSAGDVVQSAVNYNDLALTARYTGKYDELIGSLSKPQKDPFLELRFYAHNQLLGRPDIAAKLAPTLLVAGDDFRRGMVTAAAKVMTQRAGDLVANPAADWALIEAGFKACPEQLDSPMALEPALEYLRTVDLREPAQALADRYCAAIDAGKEAQNEKFQRQFLQPYLEWLKHPRAAEFEAVLADKGYAHVHRDFGWPIDHAEIRREAERLARKGDELAAERALEKIGRLSARDYAPLVAARYSGGGSTAAFAWLNRLAPKGGDKDFDVLAAKAQAATMLARLADRAGNAADTQRAVESAIADAIAAEQSLADFNAAVVKDYDRRQWPKMEGKLVSPGMLVAHMLVDLEDFANALAFVVQLPESKAYPAAAEEVWRYIFLQAALADVPFVLDALLESMPRDFNPAVRDDMLVLAAQALVHAGDPDAAAALADSASVELRAAMLRAVVIEHAFRGELDPALHANARLRRFAMIAHASDVTFLSDLAFAGLAVACAQARAGQADVATATATTAGLGNPALSPHGYNGRSTIDTTRKIAHVIAAAGPSSDALAAWLAAITDPVQRNAVATGIAQGLAGVPIQVYHRVPDERRRAHGF